MKNIILFFLGIITLSCFSQKKKTTKTGNVNLSELQMITYEKDTTANAVVLFEHANRYLDEDKDYKTTTDYYFKIKILKKEGSNKAIIKIPIYGNEELHSIKGVTYNLNETEKIIKNHLTDNKIFTKDLYKKWKEVTFSLPNIKAGSVIEYSYSITSRYSRIEDWHFQSDIPKVESKFTASILGNWKYKIRVVGFLKLNTNDTSVKKNCISIPGMGTGACLILNFSMIDIPSFKEEDYMLSKENFISKLSFELESYTSPRGGIEKFTKTWKDADRKLKTDFLDNQSSKKNYFRKNLPLEIFSSKENLEKATKVFNHIQNHFTWNGKHWPSRKVKVKKAYENKTGNIFDINLALYNSLQAANIESYLVLTSTRDKAIPTRLHPVVNDFNYLLVKTIINNKIYFLDATNKQLPFGLVQFKALNGDGRVMDFKNGSYWESLKLNQKTNKSIRAQLSFNEENELTGNLMITSKGYFGVNEREEINSSSKESYIEEFESDHPNLEVNDYDFKNLEENNKPLHKIYNVNFDQLEFDNSIRISPFLINRYTKNPFKLNERDYPVDYGYPRSYTYTLSLKIPKGYSLNKLPENKVVSLPNKGGRYILNYKLLGNTLNVYCKTSINKKLFSNTEYHYLKEFYNQIIQSQEVFIELKKASN